MKSDIIRSIKKIFAVTLAGAMLCGTAAFAESVGFLGEQLGSLTVRAVEETPASSFSYEKCDGKITITGFNGSETEVVIPSEIDGMPVTSIGDLAFCGCEEITSITIGNSVTSVGYAAFSCCTGLTSITIGNSVTSIEDYAALNGCAGLTSINVNENNVKYSSQDGVLFDKDKTTVILCPRGKSGKFSIPDSVTDIEMWAFSGCTKLTNVIIPDGVTSIGHSAFYECTGFTSMSVPDSVKFIESYAFSGCTKLTNVTIPDGVTSIGNSAFYNCTGLASITIPSSVTEIGEKAFGYYYDTNIGMNNMISDFKIICEINSAAESYAITNGFDHSIPEVFATSVTISKTSETIEKGKTINLTATVAPENTTNKTLKWTSTNNSVATVENGKVTAKSVGTAIIKVTTSNYLNASCTITVKEPEVLATGISLNKTSSTLGVGESLNITVSFSPSTVTNKKVTWTSSNSSVASVSAGKVTAKKVGSTTITAKTSNGKTASCSITVKNAPTSASFSKTSVILGVGETLKLNPKLPDGTASNTRKYSSSDSTVATYSSGTITAKKAGIAIVTVTLFNGKKASCTVTVKKAPASVSLAKQSVTLGVGEKLDLKPKLQDGTASYSKEYSTTNSSVATYINGTITAKKVGTSTATVTLFNGKQASCKVTVKKAPSSATFSKTSVTLGVGETLKLNPSLPDGTASYYRNYKSSNTSIVTYAGGTITAKKVGTATVTVTLFNGKKASCKITVKSAPSKITLSETTKVITIGKSFTLTSTLPNNSASYSIKWSSSDESIATVNSKGKVTALKYGNATITAKTYNGKTAKCTVKVKKPATDIVLSGKKSGVEVGKSFQVTATLYPKNQTDGYVKWSSSDSSIATVNNGLVTGKGMGAVTITATSSNGKTASFRVKVGKKFTFLVNKNTNCYHTYNCGAVKRMNDENKIYVTVYGKNYNDAYSEMERLGYWRCSYCS